MRAPLGSLSWALYVSVALFCSYARAVLLSCFLTARAFPLNALLALRGLFSSALESTTQVRGAAAALQEHTIVSGLEQLRLLSQMRAVAPVPLQGLEIGL